eukprot:4074-Rhodomonas_salina.1
MADGVPGYPGTGHAGATGVPGYPVWGTRVHEREREAEKLAFLDAWPIALSYNPVVPGTFLELP